MLNPSGTPNVRLRWFNGFCASVGYGLSLLAGLLFLAFFLTHVAPGDPARIILGANAREDSVQALRSEMGFDRPLLRQFTDYSWRLLSGRWGNSWLARRPVLAEIGEHLGPTIRIGIVAVLFALGTAIALNACFFWIPHLRWIVNVTRFGVAIPGVVLAMGGALLASRWSSGLSIEKFSFVPGVSAGLYTSCLITSLLSDRLSQIEASSAFRATEALGFGRFHIFNRVLLSNARSLLTTLCVNQLGLIFFSTIIVEQIFSIRGLGALLVRSIQGKDLPVISAILLLNGVFFLVVHFFQAKGTSSQFREVPI
ncbi:MAG: ABC transporter permease [Verrucomicrobiota bacterium]|nr:ABC transporter permease [Verrucomicrobiota bacterium]